VSNFEKCVGSSVNGVWVLVWRSVLIVLELYVCRYFLKERNKNGLNVAFYSFSVWDETNSAFGNKLSTNLGNITSV